MYARLLAAIKKFLSREYGLAPVECAVMLPLIIVLCLLAVTALGSNANATFSTVSNVAGS